MSERNQTIAIIAGLIAIFALLTGAVESGKVQRNLEAEQAKAERARHELELEKLRQEWARFEKGFEKGETTP